MWSWPSTSVRKRSSSALKRTLGLRKRRYAVSGLKLRSPATSSGLSSGSIGRMKTVVPSSRVRSMRCMMQRTPLVPQVGLALPLVDRHVGQLALARVDLTRTRDLLLLVVDHLEPLGD